MQASFFEGYGEGLCDFEFGAKEKGVSDEASLRIRVLKLTLSVPRRGQLS